ncbi:MAG: arginine deiminase-related protein [Actinomycetia bacterium]|nr:arginine deiminase-related protein [Actinomycetes bacterium]
MSQPISQAPSAVVMIRPHQFSPNPATVVDNAFQSMPSGTPGEIARRAYDEVSAMADQLREAGVTVHLYEDATHTAPDSVFPNNWFSTHNSGQVAVFPMHSLSRRSERRVDIIDALKAAYHVPVVYDYSGLEHDGLFLEGTGSMVLDHLARVAYVCRSNRVSEPALQRFCTDFSYHAFIFDAFDPSGTRIYHTNVLMAVATEYALIGLGAITDQRQRRRVRGHLEATGRRVVELGMEQLTDFAGNAIEVQGSDGRILVMSRRAVETLTSEQRDVIEASSTILPVDIGTIEHAGGSARCMLAGVHLSPRIGGDIDEVQDVPDPGLLRPI